MHECMRGNIAKGLIMEELDNLDEPLIRILRLIIRFAVRCLAVMMTMVILWGVIDVAWVIYGKLTTEPVMLLTISDMLATFGAFMAVLIAIEIFINITIYLRDDVIHVKIVMATALMAIARKVIILDYNQISPDYIWATAGVVVAMSIGYYLVVKHIEGTRVVCSPVDYNQVGPAPLSNQAGEPADRKYRPNPKN
jgi:uncharacterized membrane protein (DUF373 family)